MNGNRGLDSAINAVLEQIKPQQSDWEIRFHVIEELRRVIGSVDTLIDAQATLEPFGSFVANLFTRSGDLDLSIQLGYTTHITFVGKKHKLKILTELLKAMREAGFRKLQFVENARVPILKYEASFKRIACDISVENLYGQMKSKFLLLLGDIDGRFRDMVLLVKEWAKTHDINNPKYGSFNSYSLSLLVIFHFQTCTPPIFPPMKDLYLGNAADDLKGVRADAERRVAETFTAGIHKFKANNGRPTNRNSLSDLFVSFLCKFTSIAERAVDFGICPYTGRWERLATNTVWLPKTYALFVEDPFEQPDNTARAIGQRQLLRISEVFEYSHRKLVSGNPDSSSMLAVLTKPAGARHGMGPPPSRRNESYSNGQSSNYVPRPHREVRPPHPHQQQQRQQPLRIGSGHPGLMAGPGNRSGGPIQQSPKSSSSMRPQLQAQPQPRSRPPPSGVRPPKIEKQAQWRPRFKMQPSASNEA